MLAKPLKETAVDARFENIVKPAFVADGETAWAKRTQGIHQAAGRFAPSSRLIQPRKQLGCGSQSGNVTGWQQSVSRTMASGIGLHRGRVRSWRGEREAFKMNWIRKERLNPAPRTREASPPSFTRDRKVIDDQLREDIIGSGEESDSPIVVQDGKTDHTLREATAERALAKGWAEGQSDHSTHVGKGLFPLDVSRSLFAFETKVTTFGESPSLHARLSEEPGAGKPHDGSARGTPGNRRSYLNTSRMLTLKQPHKFEEYLETIALLKIRAASFEKQFCITLDRYDEDGLGPAIGGVIHNPSGIHFVVQELELVKYPRICISVPTSQASTETVDAILHFLSLSVDDCYWTLIDGYEGVPFTIFREDDNGHRSMIGTYSTKIEADLRIEELEASHHKQFYWAQPTPEKR